MLYEEDLGKDCPDFPNWAALCTRVDLTVAPMEEPSKKLNPSYPSPPQAPVLTDDNSITVGFQREQVTIKRGGY